jgi:dTDP-4-dehydrorhamnose reductase
MRVVATSTRGLLHIRGVESRSWDSSDATTVEPLLAACRPDYVVLAFAVRGDSRPYTTAARERDVGATASIARWCERSGARLVLLSSGSVFEAGGGPSAEARAPAVMTEYGRFKAGQEAAVKASSADALIIRFCQALGRDSGHPTRFERLAGALSRGERVPRSGDWSTNDACVDDLVESIDLLLQQGARGVVHLGSLDGATQADSARRLARLLGVSPELVVETRDDAIRDCRLIIEHGRSLLPARLFPDQDALLARALADRAGPSQKVG